MSPADVVMALVLLAGFVWAWASARREFTRRRRDWHWDG